MIDCVHVCVITALYMHKQVHKVTFCLKSHVIYPRTQLYLDIFVMSTVTIMKVFKIKYFNIYLDVSIHTNKPNPEHLPEFRYIRYSKSYRHFSN